MANPLPDKTIEWVGEIDGVVRMIDQTLLPAEFKLLDCRDVETVWEAIRVLRVRGAPAIGVAAAMGLVLGIRDADSPAAFNKKLAETADYLASSRPTAVNLFWALDRMKAKAASLADRPVPERIEGLLAEAKAIRDEDAAMCRAIGEAGEHLIAEGATIVTHCNAGALATAEYGTALSVMYVAREKGRSFKVFADETRPLLQGARLTAWELSRAGIDVTVNCDNMAGQLMQAGRVDLVITGADRIAANGDAANKIGTYSLAVLAKYHQVPFYVAAPSSTFDLSIADGSAIPIEQRDREEVACGFGRATVPDGVACYNPAFDVTPAELIAGLITERGLIVPVTTEEIRRVLTAGASAPAPASS